MESVLDRSPKEESAADVGAQAPFSWSQYAAPAAGEHPSCLCVLRCLTRSGFDSLFRSRQSIIKFVGKPVPEELPGLGRFRGREELNKIKNEKCRRFIESLPVTPGLNLEDAFPQARQSSNFDFESCSKSGTRLMRRPWSS